MNIYLQRILYLMYSFDGRIFILLILSIEKVVSADAQNISKITKSEIDIAGKKFPLEQVNLNLKSYK